MSVYVFGASSEMPSRRVTGICITKDGMVKVKDVLGQEYEVSQDIYLARGYQPDLSQLPIE